MPREFVIYGESLVKVRGNIASPLLFLTELGLAEQEIHIIPTFYHQDIHVDDFGPNVPVEVHSMLAEVMINMVLINYDPLVLEYCLSESQGIPSVSGPSTLSGPGNQWGKFNGAGTMLGNYEPMFSSGNHYLEVDIITALNEPDWSFKSCYFATKPVLIPLGVKRTKAEVNIRCIPYTIPLLSGQTTTIILSGGVTTVPLDVVNYSGEIMSSGVILFDHDFQDFSPP